MMQRLIPAVVLSLAMSSVTTPAFGQANITWLYQSPDSVPVTGTDSGDTVAYPAAYRLEPSGRSPLQVYNLLVYTDDWVHTTPNTFVQQALTRLGVSATVHVDGDYSGFETSLASGTSWDLVVWSGENFQVPSSTLTALLTYVQGGGRLAATYWRQLSIPTDPLWAEMGFTYVDNYIAPPAAYWWEPAHPVFTNPESAPEWLARQQNSGSSQGTYLEPTSSGLAVAGYTQGATANEGGLIIRSDGRTIYKGLRDVSTDADADGDGVLDGVELWENIITNLLEIPLTTLDLAVTAADGGTVSGRGIDCPGDCTQQFVQYFTVDLTASPAPGFAFDSWSGCDDPSGTICTMTMDIDHSITATFVPVVTLDVDLSPPDGGSVTGSGIDCPGDCTESVALGDTVVLTANPSSTYDFAGWTGCDEVSGTTCTVVMGAATTVTAQFVARVPALTRSGLTLLVLLTALAGAILLRRFL